MQNYQRQGYPLATKIYKVIYKFDHCDAYMFAES